MRHPQSSSSSSSSCPISPSAAGAIRTGGYGSTKTTPTPCCNKVGLKRGPWTPEEDEKLANYVKREGEGRWRMLPKRAGLLRCGKSCRLRWMNYLRPSVKRGRIAPDEEDLIIRLHSLLGNRWSLIAGRIPGRTDNEIKNFWNTHLRKKLISQGIDPKTHKPVNPYSSDDNPPSSSSSKAHIQMPNVPNAKLVTPALEEPISSSRPLGLQCHGHVNLQNSHGLISKEEDDDDHDDDIDYCNDGLLSSFLNSLLDEDIFDTTIQHPVLQAAACDEDPLILSPSRAFAMDGCSSTAE